MRGTSWAFMESQETAQQLIFVPYRSINARKKALEAEKERSARVASLPLPPPNPIQVILQTPFNLQGYQLQQRLFSVCIPLFCVITHIYLLEH